MNWKRYEKKTSRNLNARLAIGWKYSPRDSWFRSRNVLNKNQECCSQNCNFLFQILRPGSVITNRKYTVMGDRTFGWQNVWVTESLGGRTFGRQNVWVTERLGGRTFGWHNVWVTESLGGRTFGRQNVWVAERLGDRTFWWQNVWVTERFAGERHGTISSVLEVCSGQ
jgi:hypothetical protein